MNKCDICIEETCKGKHDCRCETCDKRDKCYREFRPTIRITNKCTQMCSHCCFESSPSSNIHMTVEKAKEIAEFLKKGDIRFLNLMGGEFFCNPDWKEIFTILTDSVQLSRIVTNGDWATSPQEVLDWAKDRKGIYFCISHDQWHTNKNHDEAFKLLEEAGVIVRSGKNQLKGDGIVPVGRSEYQESFYSFLGQHCHNPEHMYSFLIDEEGSTYRCGFGLWKFSSVSSPTFKADWKDFAMRHYKAPLLTCTRCIRAESFGDRERLKRL